MKKLTSIALVFAATSTFAVVENVQTSPSSNPRAQLSPEERAARIAKVNEMRLKKYGGHIVKPGSLKGEICYVDCQNRIPKAWVDDSIAYFRHQTKFNITYKKGSFNLSDPKISGNASLFLIDDAKLPVILVAPENRWAFLNVSPIAAEKRPAFFEARVRKQMSRVFAYLCGASNSQYLLSLTRGIVDEADLDQNADHRLPMDVLQRFRAYMEPLGVTPEVQVYYRAAVEEGWAPQPTNDYQKAIWEQIHAMPTAPIKIKPETKKVEK